jgi:hypothetical protein
MKAALDMAHWFESHSLELLSGKRRSQSAGAEKDKFLAGVENLAMIWRRRIDPKLEHPARRMQRSGNTTVAFEFANVANIDKHHVRVILELKRVGGSDGFDLGVGLSH